VSTTSYVTPFFFNHQQQNKIKEGRKISVSSHNSTVEKETAFQVLTHIITSIKSPTSIRLFDNDGLEEVN